MNEVPWSVRKSVCAEAEAQERKWYFIWFVFDASWWSIPGIYRKENVEGEQFAPSANSEDHHGHCQLIKPEKIEP